MQAWKMTSLAFIACGLGLAGQANATDVVITNAQITAGKLVVTGKTALPNTHVRLDGQTAAAFNVTSAGNRAFKFSLVYLPSDCIVGVQPIKPPSTVGEAANAVVADCGARGVSPRGA